MEWNRYGLQSVSGSKRLTCDSALTVRAEAALTVGRQDPSAAASACARPAGVRTSSSAREKLSRRRKNCFQPQSSESPPPPPPAFAVAAS